MTSRTTRVVTRTLAIATLALGVIPIETGPVEASINTSTCVPNNSPCVITPSQPGNLTLSRNVAMAAVTFSTNVGVSAGNAYFTRYDSNNSNIGVLYPTDNFPSRTTPAPSGTNPLPNGVTATVTSLNPFTVTLDGTPTATGTWLLELTAIDQATPTEQAYHSFTITVVNDTTPPVLQSAVVPSTGDSLVLTYDEALLGASIFAASFTVSVDGTPQVGLVATATVSGTTVTLGFAAGRKIEAGATVTVSYTPPGTNPIEDASGNDAAALTNNAVTNNSTVDLTAPVLQSATVPVGGGEVALQYDETLTQGTVDANSFAVSVDGTTVTPTSAQAVSDTVTLSLTVADTIGDGATVTVSYAPPGTNPIEDAAGNDAAALRTAAGTNNSTRDVTAPTLVSAVADEDGRTITLTFDEVVEPAQVQANSFTRSRPEADDFTVTIDGVLDVPVSGVTIDDETVTLDLEYLIFEDVDVTVGYTPAVRRELQDASGNTVAAIVDRTVDNRSTFPMPTPPTDEATTTTTTATDPVSAESAPTTSAPEAAAVDLPATASSRVGPVVGLAAFVLGLGLMATRVRRPATTRD